MVKRKRSSRKMFTTKNVVGFAYQIKMNMVYFSSILELKELKVTFNW